MFSSVSLRGLSAEYNGRTVSIVGILANVQVKRAQKTGKRYALAELQEAAGLTPHPDHVVDDMDPTQPTEPPEPATQADDESLV